MNLSTVIGIILVFLGLFSFIYERIDYTKEEQVLKIGPIEGTIKHDKSVWIPPIVGVLSVAGGIILIYLGTKKS